MGKRKRIISVENLESLANFRHQLRLFLNFSENAAMKLGLKPQQHQLLLQVAGVPDGIAATVGYVAQRLVLRHNTVVELAIRCEKAGLIVRKQSQPDARTVVLKVSARGLSHVTMLAS